jgi:hypothetical protein
VSLYGIENEDDCRARIDESVEMQRLAKAAMDKETIARLNAELTKYYIRGNTNKGKDQMSKAESDYFWPAIQEAHAFRPSLTQRTKWSEQLDEVEWKLQKNRPERR